MTSRNQQQAFSYRNNKRRRTLSLGFLLLSSIQLFCRISIPGVLVFIIPTASATTSSSNDNTNIRYYPQRHQDEAAVIEWGHSAIISALDAVVADFGPQTSQAALLEVETTPILANPISGVNLENAPEFHGNVAIVTDTELSGYELAKLFQSHGAAAVVVVHVDRDSQQPDALSRIYKPNDGDVDIDIPVVSISWTAANVLTTALLPEDQRRHSGSTLSPDGLPDRIRLYAGGDRPFFEDIEANHPTIYLIHNLLTDEECNELMQVKLQQTITETTKPDCLHYTDDVQHMKQSKTQRAVQWQGMLQMPHQKAIEERIDQVTGFPTAHLSDFIIDKIESGGRWDRHYDSLLRSYVPLASVTVFLEDSNGIWKFPQTKRGSEIHIKARKGMAIVYHNTDDTQRFDPYAIHELDTTNGPLHIARKIVLPMPPSLGRRILLPAVAMMNAGRLPTFISNFHESLIETYGVDDGPRYFDMGLMAIPAVVLLGIVRLVVYFVTRKPAGSDAASASGGTKKTKKA